MPSVSRFSGTSGHSSSGRLSGSSPWSPTVGIVIDIQTTSTVTTTTATSGAGTTVVRRGIPIKMRRPRATKG